MGSERATASVLHRLAAILAAVAVGLFIGVAIFGVKYSSMTSYLSSDPKACVNCHVMQPEYDAWSRGPHRNVATCDDCHLPQDSVVAKYSAQIQDGIIHGYKFTTNSYPTNIKIRDTSLAVVNSSCLRCHGAMTSAMRTSLKPGETITCTHCHQNVGHDS